MASNLRISTDQQKVVDLSRGCSIKSFKLKSKKAKFVFGTGETCQ